MNIRLIGPLLVFLVCGGCAHVATYDYFTDGTPADQVVTVTVPPEVKIRTINGEKAPGRMAWSTAKAYEMRVAAGPQTWEVRYYDPFLDDGETIDKNAVDRSDYMPLTFTTEPGKTYRLRFETPSQNPALQNAAQQVRIWAEDQQQQRIGVTTAPTPKKKPMEKEEKKKNSATLEQLQQLWTTAGDDDRKEFRNWIDHP